MQSACSKRGGVASVAIGKAVPAQLVGTEKLHQRPYLDSHELASRFSIIRPIFGFDLEP